MSPCKHLGLALAWVAALAVPTAAQQTMDVASISGRIVDGTGAVVPGAQVTATRLDTNVVASAITDTDGRFRLSRNFRLTSRWQLEIPAEGFNLTNRANVVTRNTNFGPGAYPDNPSPTYGQVTAVGEPRAFQFGGRLRF